MTNAGNVTDLGYVLAQAWEEGFYAGVAADMGDWEHPPEIIPNPYLSEPNDEHTPLPESETSMNEPYYQDPEKERL